MGYYVFLVVATLVLVAIAIRWPALGLAVLVVGQPVILVAQFYARLEGYATYYQGFLAMFCAMVAWLHEPRWYRLSSPIFWWGLFVSLLFGLGLFTIRGSGTNVWDYGLVKFMSFGAVAMPLLIGGCLLADRQRRFEQTVICLVIVSLVAYITHLVFLQSGRIDLAAMSRYSELGSPINVGRSAATGVLTFIYLLLFRRARLGLPLWIGALIVGLVITVLAASRGPLLSLFVAVILVYAFRVRKVLLGLVVAALTLGLLLVILYKYAPMGVFERLTVFALRDVTGSGRTPLYQLGLQAGLNAFWTGQGTGGFLAFSGFEKYPHNLFIELFAEFGLSGLIAGAAFAFFLIKYGLRCIQLRPVLGPKCDLVLSLVVFGLVNAMFSSDLPGQHTLWLGCGMMAGLDRLAKWEYEGAALAPLPSEGPIEEPVTGGF